MDKRKSKDSKLGERMRDFEFVIVSEPKLKKPDRAKDEK
jgi:hypothetical protein